jgi:hypothetical protein
MKITVRTSAPVRVYHADGFYRPRTRQKSVHADVGVRPCGRNPASVRTGRVCADRARPRGRNPPSARTWRVSAEATQCPRGHGASARTHAFPPSLPPSPADAACCPCGRWATTTWMREKKKKKGFFIFFGSCCRLGKREIFGFRFSVFDPQNPQTPQAPRALRAKPREEEGFFGLVPLVTHPSSIPLLGGLTPKFLSLSLHSL